MKKILIFSNGSTAMVEGRKSINKNANLATSTSITINKEEPIDVYEATPENIKKYIKQGKIKKK